MKQTTVLRLQGLFEISAVFLFFIGYYGGILPIMFIGAAMLVVDILSTILLGVLNPIYPLALVILLSMVFTPWYYGLFWACAIFSVLGSFNSFRKVIVPDKVLQDTPGKT